MASVLKPWLMTGGVTQLSSAEGRTFARQLLGSEDYRSWLTDRIKNRTLPTNIEQMLWAYAYGKPVEQVKLSVGQTQEDLSALTLAEMRERVSQLQHALEEAEELNHALPAQY